MSVDENLSEIVNSNNKELEFSSLTENLKDSKYLPPYRPLKRYIHSLIEDERGKVEEYTQLHGNISLLIALNDSENISFKKSFPKTVEGNNLHHFLYKQNIFEIITDEYINHLGNYLDIRIEELQAQSTKPVTVLEVAAGGGRLSYQLNKYFKNNNINTHIVATDSGEDDLMKGIPVEKLNHKQALEKYAHNGPTIVICSWMHKGLI